MAKTAQSTRPRLTERTVISGTSSPGTTGT